ncbi:ABC transporter ATP-binding protein [Paramicrobacterium fandaimingii]|uniref:ABC transporter ATP-binding protein n=1 Tax=Paramicrobacterium fandaimingii TaxID=2708079 RepID=UPI001421614F|nr:ATP-binding cassette domain-containing protein [Microbacterium fandaimingii]
MTRAVIDLTDVSFTRNGNRILSDVSFTARTGEHWALLGPNGAGKSTMLGFCGARTHPTSGTVEILGERLGRVDMQELRRGIGHVDPRHPVRSPLPVIDVVLTGLTGTIELPMRWEPTAHEAARARALIDQVGLSSRSDALWPTLSQGERGRALIARALVAQPRLLLLDEPTTGLDVAAREQLLETIDDLAVTAPNVATVLVTHHLEELPVSTTHSLVIAEGAVVASGIAADVITSETISRAFAHPIRVGTEDGRWSARAVRRMRDSDAAALSA